MASIFLVMIMTGPFPDTFSDRHFCLVQFSFNSDLGQVRGRSREGAGKDILYQSVVSGCVVGLAVCCRDSAGTAVPHCGLCWPD